MRLKLIHRAWFFVLALVFIALTIYLATINPEGSFRDFILQYGYVGFFVSAFIGGFNLIVPISHIIFVVPFLSAGLNPWTLILIGALGTTLADTLGYFIGRTGEMSFSKYLARFKIWGEKVINKYPKFAPVILFLWASFVPLPNELLVIPAGIVRYKFKKIIVIVFLGNLVFNLLAVKVGGIFI